MLVAALMTLIMTLVSEKKIQPLIAKALRTNLNKSVELSMKAVKGLAVRLLEGICTDN